MTKKPRYRLEKRGKTMCLVGRSFGCRPATDGEIYFARALRSALRDKERVDWLLKDGNSIKKRSNGLWYAVSDGLQRRGGCWLDWFAKTPRRAIDAAIRNFKSRAARKSRKEGSVPSVLSQG